MAIVIEAFLIVHGLHYILSFYCVHYQGSGWRVLNEASSV